MEMKSFIEKNKIYIGAFCLMGLVGLFSHLSKPKEVVPASQAIDSVDTLIPRGHVLIPLELENLEHISSLIGSSGVVDLYTGGENKKRKLVASRIKIVQAPFNPQVYAALVKEADGTVIQNYLGPFRATVQNPTQAGTRVTKSSSQRLSITYQR